MLVEVLETPVAPEQNGVKKSNRRPRWHRKPKPQQNDQPEVQPQPESSSKADSGVKNPVKRRKPPVCKYYKSTGNCKFGESCRYRHIQNADQKVRIIISRIDLIMTHSIFRT